MNITGTGSAHPSLTVTNEMLADFLDTSDEWIVTRTGIKQRQIISNERLEDLAATAADNALTDAGIKASELDFIICSNVVNEYITPSMSCIIQGKIGAECPCIDINGACAGFIYALDMANSFFQSKSEINTILIVCAEEPTRMVDWQQRNTCVLFGDGAGAVVLTRGNDFKAVKLTSISKSEALYQMRKLESTPFISKDEPDGPLVMKGQDVFKLAVAASLKDIECVVRESGNTYDDVDHYLLHQANIRIIETIRNYINQSEEKFPHNIENYGNTSSASIPILLDELNRNKQLKCGDTLVLSAFGAGFTAGACLFKWSKN
ncbi:MAG: ketoacyl-ACP synthase III [Bacteroidales bacterium]|nr:ketoacyl-ACP synthase III [Bacteroidales bacterium]MDD4670262.1 ketoacyl-ACP synthase III [Bacteroidales bacterium]